MLIVSVNSKEQVEIHS